MKQLSIYQDIEHYGATSYAADPVSVAVAGDVDHNLQRLPNNEQYSSLTEQPESVQANVTEIIIAKDKADNVQMILPMLTHLSQENRWLAWVDPPIQLLKQWRAKTNGLHSSEIMIIRSDKQQAALELTKKALKAGTCHAVIVWTENLSQDQFDELEAASAKGDSHGIVLRYR